MSFYSPILWFWSRAKLCRSTSPVNLSFIKQICDIELNLLCVTAASQSTGVKAEKEVGAPTQRRRTFCIFFLFVADFFFLFIGGADFC